MYSRRARWGTVRYFCLAPNEAAAAFFARFGFAEVGSQLNREVPGDLVELRR